MLYWAFFFFNCQVSCKIPFFIPLLEVELSHERRRMDMFSLLMFGGPGRRGLLWCLCRVDNGLHFTPPPHPRLLLFFCYSWNVENWRCKLFFLALWHGLLGCSYPTGNWTWALGVNVLSPNHWTTSEFLKMQTVIHLYSKVSYGLWILGKMVLWRQISILACCLWTLMWIIIFLK